jgi:hypothetical protein
MSNSTKDKLVRYFMNPVRNTLTVDRARSLFKVHNVSARVNELRQEGFSIYTNFKKVNGRKVKYYRLGSPSENYLKNLRANRVREALKALQPRSRAA